VPRRPRSRPKPELPPFPAGFENGRKRRKAFDEWLFRLRIEYGPNAFFDTKRHRLRYPIADVFLALCKYQKSLLTLGITPRLSIEETRFRNKKFSLGKHFRRSFDGASIKILAFFRVLSVHAMNEPLFPPSDRRRTVNMPELAELTGIPLTTIRQYVARGEIPGAMRSGKRGRWRFDRLSLEIWWPTIRKTEFVRPANQLTKQSRSAPWASTRRT
jgi:excisionase family DNA binding protein